MTQIWDLVRLYGVRVRFRVRCQVVQRVWESRKNVQKNLVQKKLGVKKQVLKKLGVEKQLQKKPFLVYYTPSFFYTWFFLHLQKCHFFGQKSKNRCRKNQKSRCRIGHFRQVQNRPGVEKTGCRIGPTQVQVLAVIFFTIIFRQLPVLSENVSSERKSDTIPRICDQKCPEIFKPLTQFKNK